MSAMPRKRRLAVEASSVAMGHLRTLQRSKTLVTYILQATTIGVLRLAHREALDAFLLDTTLIYINWNRTTPETLTVSEALAAGRQQ